jgi:hypothetical protein
MKREPEDLIRIILVAWESNGGEVWDKVKRGLLRAIRGMLPEAVLKENTRPQDPFKKLAEEFLDSEEGMRIAYCRTDALPLEKTVEEAVQEGARQVIIVPLAFAVETPIRSERPLLDLRSTVSKLEARYPAIDIMLFGPPFGSPCNIENLLSKIKQYEPDAAELLKGVVVRGFQGKWSLFARFMEKLQAALPPETRVCIRGSTVTGYNYVSEEPFDSAGEGTSDLDLVLVGARVLERWDPEGFYIPGILTMPLDEKHPEFSPWLEPVRRELEQMVGRPVHIQAMPQWFLDLRKGVQRTPYLSLDS